MIDIVFVAVIAVFAYMGAKRGFAKSLVGLISTFVSLIAGIIIYKPVSAFLADSKAAELVRNYITEYFSKNARGTTAFFLNSQSGIEGLTVIVLNVISFVAVILISKLAVSLLSHIVNFTAHLPLLKQANSLLGMLTGILCGFLVCYIAAGILSVISLETDILESSLLFSSLCGKNFIADLLGAIANKN